MSENAKKTKPDENQQHTVSEYNPEENLNDVVIEDSDDSQNNPEEDYKAIIDDLNDKLLRSIAEAQNTRRRADIDIQNARSYGIQSFAKDLLGVMDNLFRAIETLPADDAEQNSTLKAIKEGVEITKREMINVFERNGIKRIEPVAQAFDPNLHQAISQVVDASVAEGTVLQVLQSGYILKDRLLRPALVVVSKAS